MPDLTNDSHSHNRRTIGSPPWVTSRSPRLRNRGPRRGSWLIAGRCRLRRTAIDRELAAGADPESSECLHRRASELTRESDRHALAAAYERHLNASTNFPQLDVLRVNWPAVRAATPRLQRLVQRLREDPGVTPRGVARARLLLTDRDSPIYVQGDTVRFEDEVRSTLALL
jgi:hypothetical protein